MSNALMSTNVPIQKEMYLLRACYLINNDFRIFPAKIARAEELVEATRKQKIVDIVFSARSKLGVSSIQVPHGAIRNLVRGLTPLTYDDCSTCLGTAHCRESAVRRTKKV